MDTILSFLTSGGSTIVGGIFGGLTSIANSWIKYKEDKDKRAYEREEAANKRAHDLAMLSAETDNAIKEIEASVERDRVIMEGKADVEESKTRSLILTNYDRDSVAEDTITWMMKNKNLYTAWLTLPIGVILITANGFVDLLRKLVRPVVTYGSIGFSFFLLWFCFEQLQAMNVAFTPAEWKDILMTQLRLVEFIASSAAGFWFADKSMSRKYQDSTLIK
jgi:hypothetical protein